MIKSIIIDDEKTSRDALKGLIRFYCKNVEVIAEANGYKNGLNVIKQHKPDVIFLDVQMPDGSGFKLLEELGEINFEIIFATAHEQYALRAIKASALDYLLKPINPDDLIISINKLELKMQKGIDNTGIKHLIDIYDKKPQEIKTITLRNAEGMFVVNIVDIIRCEADDCYTKFYLNNKKTYMVSSPLKENEEILEGHNFIRPHKSHLININCIKSYIRLDGGSIVMSDESIVPVSRRKREQIIDIINHL